MLETEILLCMDRAIGHDWPHEMEWRSPYVVHRGKRDIIEMCHRVARCARCGTVRRELFVFERGGKWLYKIANGNRYEYSKAWKQAARVPQHELRGMFYARSGNGR